MKGILLIFIFMLTACAGPGGMTWGVLPADRNVCPTGKSASGHCR